MTGIICPSEFEYQFLSHSEIQKKDAALIHSGMGKVRALYACHRLLKDNPGLTSILLVGFAGALTPSLKIGDIIEPSLFIEQDYNAEPLEKFPNAIKKSEPTQMIADSQDAVMLTQDRFLKENPYGAIPYPERCAARGERPRLACDMESYAVAYFCENSHVQYAVIKLISDCADGNADHDFLKACRELSPKLNKTVLQAVEKTHFR